MRKGVRSVIYKIKDERRLRKSKKHERNNICQKKWEQCDKLEKGKICEKKLYKFEIKWDVWEKWEKYERSWYMWISEKCKIKGDM